MCRLIVALCLLSAVAAQAAAPPDPVSRAIHRGLRRLEEGAGNYISNRQCFSCHHQSLTIAAMVSARARGFTVSDTFLEEQTTFTLDSFRNNLGKVRKGENVGGRSTTVAYALFTLQTAGHPADETTEALIDYLLIHQEKDGSWPAVMPRLPSEGSKFTNAALALAALRHYGSRDRTKDRLPEKIAPAFRRGVAWLEKNDPKDTEDRTFHLRALITAGASQERIGKARQALIEQQLTDGSWRQTGSRSGDAYATGTVLQALRLGGVKPDEEPYRKGVAYLLRSQSREGAWIVTTRNKPVQRWFDNGDPGGKSQFISFLATGWATLALLETLPAKAPEKGVLGLGR